MGRAARSQRGKAAEYERRGGDAPARNDLMTGSTEFGEPNSVAWVGSLRGQAKRTVASMLLRVALE